jgi:hypothetical protein
MPPLEFPRIVVHLDYLLTPLPVCRIPWHLPTWLTWFKASAKSFWLMPQRLATFSRHLWCTFMPQSGVREKATNVRTQPRAERGRGGSGRKENFGEGC